jgi:hypothetical protein
MLEKKTQKQDTLLADEALVSLVNSAYFCGVVSPRILYDYCAMPKNRRFTGINANFFYNWDTLSLQHLCHARQIPFRSSSAKDTKDQSASRVAKTLIALAKKSPKAQSCAIALSEKMGQGKNVVSAQVHRSIGMENLQYLLAINFSVKQVPPLNREDLKSFFTVLRTKKLTDIKGYVQQIRDTVSLSLLKQA